MILMIARNGTIGMHACMLANHGDIVKFRSNCNVDGGGCKISQGDAILSKDIWFGGAKYPRIFGTGVPIAKYGEVIFPMILGEKIS